MSARSEQRAAENEWRESQRGVLHDEHDTDTDPECLPPLGRVLAGLVALLFALFGFIGYVLPYFADKVIP